MDCGPAALKCLLEGFGIPVSYGRLREACQTDVDGTSIDTIEIVANQLGVAVEQEILPLEHVFLPEANTLPAVVVVRHGAGATHFVVVWRRVGKWLQVMDPSIGRRWVSCETFAEEIFNHQQSVPAAQWREWVATEDFQKPFRQRLKLIGASEQDATKLIDRSLKDDGWFTFGALDAATRLVQSVINAGGITSGSQAVKLLDTLFERTRTSTFDIYTLLPSEYWFATPDLTSIDAKHQRLILRGTVLLRASGPVNAVADLSPAAVDAEKSAPLSLELAAALREKPRHPLLTVLDLLKQDGVLAPLALVGAMIIAVGVVLIETLLFRGILDIAWILNQGCQRMAAVLALMAFVGVLMLIEAPINMETMRFGRHLETRMRMALLSKLPHLTDRYFQSRPVSDMADRSHAIQMTRNLPATGLHFLQTLWELMLTFVGVVLLDPTLLTTLVALTMALLPIVLAMAAQPMVNERDLRVRNHAGALNVFYLDAMLGLVPIRTHSAEKAVSRQHESLLVEWARSSVGLVRINMLVNGILAIACMGLAGYLLIEHFLRSGSVTGGDLLLVYWVLKLPAVGSSLSSLAQQYPGQRNVLLRLLEPLSTPEELIPTSDKAAKHGSQPRIAPNPKAVRIAIEGGSIVAAGHVILHGVNLQIAAGEHVAIVGKSGAGKSTLIGLMLGWHRLALGEFRVDGGRLMAVDQEALRRQTAWVDPGIQIWNQSFLENLGYATEDDGLERIASTIDAARLRGVLQKLPQGLQTYLGEGGGLLSGGEGQRVRLARALLQSRVRLALLDEPFRGMDRSQRNLLLTEARQWWKDTTLLCVTHDISETLPFSRVLVIENGCIVEDGSPSELLERPSRYRELLDAETMVREQMWSGKQWRHIYMQEGRIDAIGSHS